MSGSTPILQTQNLTLRFGGVAAVRDVSFDIRKGEVFTLIGPNGAGKTTIFNMISRIYHPSEGRILLDGRDITELPPHAVTQLGVARTFQNIELFEQATVLQNLLIGAHCRSRSNLFHDLFFTPVARHNEFEVRRLAEEVIDLLEIAHYRDMQVAGLSYGIRKVVELARALCAKPRLLLLDEPSSGLNPEETDDMVWWIRDIQRELGITVLMVEHDMSLVSQVSDRVLALNQGEMLSMGTAAEVQSDPAVIEAYLGTVDDVSSLRRSA